MSHIHLLKVEAPQRQKQTATKQQQPHQQQQLPTQQQPSHTKP